MADRSVRVVLSAQIADFQAKMGQAASAADGFAKRLDANRASADVLANGLLTIGTVAAVGLGFAVKASADFEQAMSNVKAAGQDAAGNFDALRAAAVEMGAQTAFSATEAASGIENLMKAGVSAEDVLGGGLSGALDLAAAGSLGVGEAAEIAATALTQFGLAGADVPHVADLLAAGAGKAQGEVADLGAALKQSGLVASQFGLSIEETVGGLSAFAAAGLLGSDAGTSLKTMLQRLAVQTPAAAKEMERLGISAYDASGNFVGLEGLAGQLKTSMSGLTPEARNAAMAIIFGSDAVRAANVLYENGAAGIAEWTAKVNDQGFAAETAATKLDNLKGDLEALGGAFESVLIDGGSGANEALRGLVQGATDAVNVIGSLPAPVLQVGAALTGLVAVGGLAAGGLLKAYTTARDLHTAFRDIVPVGSALEGKLKAIGVGAAVASAGLVAIAAGTKSVQADIARSLPPLGDLELALEKLGEGSGSVADLDANFKGLEGRAGSLGEAMEFMAARTGDSVSGFTKARDGVDGLASGLLGAKSDVEGATEAFGRLDAALVAMEPEAAAEAFAEIAAQADELGVPMDVLVELFPQYAAALQEAADASGQGVTAAEALAGAYDEQAVAAEAAESAVRDLADAALALSGSAIAVQDAIHDASESVAEHGATLDITTESGRANRTALDDIAKAALGLRDSQREANVAAAEVDGAMAANRSSFIQTATQMGLTQEEAEALADSYNLIPGDVNTSVQLEGVPAAVSGAQSVTSAVNAIPSSKTITITTVMRTAIETGSSGGGGWADGGLMSRTPAGLVRSYASGGIDQPRYVGSIGSRTNGIYPYAGKGGVIMNEDGSGPWEGIVSGHPGKRGRSRVITEEIVRRLGGDVAWRFADGGVMGGSASGGMAGVASLGGSSASAIREALDGLNVRITGASVLADEVMGRLELSIARRQ